MHIHIVQTRQHVCFMALRLLAAFWQYKLNMEIDFKSFQIQNAMKLNVQTPDASAALLTIILLQHTHSLKRSCSDSL